MAYSDHFSEWAARRTAVLVGLLAVLVVEGRLSALTVQPDLAPGMQSVVVSDIRAGVTQVEVSTSLSGATGTVQVNGESTISVPLSLPLRGGAAVWAEEYVNGTWISQSLRVTVPYLRGLGKLLVSLGVREPASVNNPQVGGNGGGGIGNVEWIGSTTAWPNAPTGTKTLLPTSQWQTVEFYPGTDPVRAFTGDGVLNGPTAPWYTLESLVFRTDPDDPQPGPYTVYVDEISNAGVTFGTFEVYQPGTSSVIFADPWDSPTTHDFLVYRYGTSLISNEHADVGMQAVRMHWHWVDDNPANWVRVTTHSSYVTYQANPLLNLGNSRLGWKPVSMRLLLCAAPDVTIDGLIAAGATQVNVSGVEPTAESVRIYANGVLVGSAAGNGQTSMSVPVMPLVAGQALSASQVMAGAEGCSCIPRIIGDCGQVASPYVGGPVVAGDTSLSVGSPSLQSTRRAFLDGQLLGEATANGAEYVQVPLSAPLAAGQAVTVTQVEQGVESCPNTTGAIVGSGRNAPLRVTLVVWDAGFEKWVGATSALAGAPQGKLIEPSGDWQSVAFTASDPVLAVHGGGNQLVGPTTFKGLAFAVDGPSGETGPYTLYLDDFPGGYETGGTLLTPPSTSAETYPHVVRRTSQVTISDVYAHSGWRSQKMSWQFVDATSARWVEFDHFGSPAELDLNAGVTVPVLLLGGLASCPGLWADADGDQDVDAADFGVVQRCLRLHGGTAGPAPLCRCLDTQEPAGVIDVADINAFAACSTGPGLPVSQPPPVGCVN